MAKRDHFLIVDTETTMDDKVADFSAIVVDRKGREYTRCAVMVHKIFDSKKHQLFHNEEGDPLWKAKNLETRYADYWRMIAEGNRMMAGITAINRWLEGVKGKYDPFLTAYNLAFDVGKCCNTGIALDIFGSNKKFCLWYAAQEKWGKTKLYRQFVLDNHNFGKRTSLGNMSYRTNAETMARFVLGNPELADEPHTALEDIIFYELPILLALVNSTKKQKWINPTAYNWRDYQLKNWFRPL